MRTIRQRVLKNGHSIVTVQIAPGERLFAFSDDALYRLGHDDGEVLPAHFLYDAEVVQWCPFEQKWI